MLSGSHKTGQTYHICGLNVVLVPTIGKPLAGILELKATLETALSIFTIGQARKQSPRGERTRYRVELLYFRLQGDNTIFSLTIRLPLMVLD